MLIQIKVSSQELNSHLPHRKQELGLLELSPVAYQCTHQNREKNQDLGPGTFIGDTLRQKSAVRKSAVEARMHHRNGEIKETGLGKGEVGI